MPISTSAPPQHHTTGVISRVMSQQSFEVHSCHTTPLCGHRDYVGGGGDDGGGDGDGDDGGGNGDGGDGGGGGGDGDGGSDELKGTSIMPRHLNHAQAPQSRPGTSITPRHLNHAQAPQSRPGTSITPRHFNNLNTYPMLFLRMVSV
ncbi:hypothetical protein FHG87_015277 [Trinorchestia longiramus]|nr:hypothetical protein FHG87_015277 [Trinorchestia longiramus]